MADTFVQLMAFNATLDYKRDKAQAALAAELCHAVNALISDNKYNALNIVGWTLEDNMKRWVEYHETNPSA